MVEKSEDKILGLRDVDFEPVAREESNNAQISPTSTEHPGSHLIEEPNLPGLVEAHEQKGGRI